MEKKDPGRFGDNEKAVGDVSPASRSIEDEDPALREPEREETLHRGLKARQISMIGMESQCGGGDWY